MRATPSGLRAFLVGGAIVSVILIAAAFYFSEMRTRPNAGAYDQEIPAKAPTSEADYQARLIASFIVALAADPQRADWFRKLKRSAHPDIGHGIPYKDTPWHKFEIHHYRFRRYIDRLLRRFGAAATRAFPQGQAAADKVRQGELERVA